MPASKKIAVMLPRFSSYGGVEQFGIRLASALASKGYSVDFICARKESNAPKGVNILCTGRPKGPQTLKMLWFCLAAEFLRRKGKYDCSISLGKTWNQDILRIGGGPLRVFWKLSEKAITDKKKRYWKKLRRKISPSNWFTLLIERRQYSGKNQIVAVSHLVKEWILDSHKWLKPESISIVYNKPDLTRFHPPKEEERKGARIVFDVPEDATAIGTASSNFKLKGIEPLIRSLALLPSRFHLFIAGGRGHKRYDELANELGITHRVHFMGRIDRMAEFYHSLDIFALPTFYDACSNAVLEALASGIDVLSSETNGSSFFLAKENIIKNLLDVDEISHKILAVSPEPKNSTDTESENNAFIWPTGIQVGIEGMIEVIEDFLEKKSNSDNN